MITIYHPRNFFLERIYIIEVLFGEFLGLDYEIYSYEGKDYHIVLENNSSLIIRDSFFSSQEDENYLELDNIPSKVKYIYNPFIVEKDIPILYGDDELTITNNEIRCGIDIFASAFFMLSRWEEYVKKDRDLHQRFPAVSSVAYINNFLDRPIVNEYVEMLWNMLIHLGVVQNRKKHQFEFIVSHDVDSISYWKDFNRTVRILGADILKRKSLPTLLEHLLELSQVKLGKKKDPFDTFDYLMNLSEVANIKSRFYFMSGGVTKYDNDYRINETTALDIIQKVKSRNHIIGFHPSYNAYNDPDQWKKEKQLLEETAQVTVKQGRQHFLRFEAPLTWNIWNDNGMEMDSTLSYADREGFRCGTCFEFPVFDFLNRKRLSLRECPLSVMEGSFTTYQNITPKYMEEKTKALLKKTKKYKGNFVYLWHNSSFNVPMWKTYQVVYENVLKTQTKVR